MTCFVVAFVPVGLTDGLRVAAFLAVFLRVTAFGNLRFSVNAGAVLMTIE